MEIFTEVIKKSKIERRCRQLRSGKSKKIQNEPIKMCPPTGVLGGGGYKNLMKQVCGTKKFELFLPRINLELLCGIYTLNNTFTLFYLYSSYLLLLYQTL